MNIILSERSKLARNAVLRRTRWQSPADYWQDARLTEYKQSELDRLNRVVPQGLDVTLRYLMQPHSIPEYWKSNEARECAILFMHECPRPANVLMCGSRILWAFREWLRAVPTSLGLPAVGKGLAEDLMLYSLPNLNHTNPQWRQPDTLRICKERLSEYLV